MSRTQTLAAFIGAGALSCGWAAAAATDLEWLSWQPSLPVHDLLVGGLVAATIVGALFVITGRRTRPAAGSEDDGYAEGVVDGMRLAAAKDDDGPTLELRPAVGATVTVLRPRRGSGPAPAHRR